MTFKDYIAQGARYLGSSIERNWPYVLGAAASSAIIYTGNQELSDLLKDSSVTTSDQWAASMMLTGKSIAALLLVTGSGEGVRSLYRRTDPLQELSNSKRNLL